MLEFKRGLRLRIALAFAIFCIFVVGTLGISLYVASGKIEEAHIDQVIEMEMEHLIERYRQQPNYIPQAGPNLGEYILPERSDEFRLPSHLQGLNQRRHAIFRGPQEVRVAVRHVEGVKFLVAYEIGLHEQRKQEFGLLIGVSIISLIVVALVVGYLLSGLLVREVADLAEQVRKLAPGNAQGVMLTQPGMDAEVAQLANALDDYQSRIGRMLQREQEFTANVSHEMRTPITTILTSCELLATEQNMPKKVRTRISMIESAATRMGEQLQALLFLAREQALGVMESVSIAECVYDVAEHLRPEIERKQLDFEVNVELGAVLTLNRQALQTTLVNLLRNAVQYTSQGSVKVKFKGSQLTISDSGIGIEPSSLPFLFERFFRGSTQGEGLGIGLAIVKRICDHYGWLIEVDSSPGYGATFRITFP